MKKTIKIGDYTACIHDIGEEGKFMITIRELPGCYEIFGKEFRGVYTELAKSILFKGLAEEHRRMERRKDFMKPKLRLIKAKKDEQKETGKTQRN